MSALVKEKVYMAFSRTLLQYRFVSLMVRLHIVALTMTLLFVTLSAVRTK